MTIDWSPATTGAEIQQCVRTLLRTAPGSVPLARALGTPQDVIDMPSSLAAQRLRSDIAAALRAYEPRVKPDKITLTTTEIGALRAKVEIVGA